MFSSSPSLRIGVIGFGQWGPNHVRNFSQADDVEVVRICQLTIVGDHKMAVRDDMNNLKPIRHYDKGVTADHYSSFSEFHLILRDGRRSPPPRWRSPTPSSSPL